MNIQQILREGIIMADDLSGLLSIPVVDISSGNKKKKQLHLPATSG